MHTTPLDSSMKLHVRFLHEEAENLYGGMLSYATEESAGLDLRACLSQACLVIPAGERLLVPSGIAIQPEPSCPEEKVAGFIYARSGLGAKHGITIAQGVGVIDSDYRGEIMIMLLNTATQSYTLQKGERVAQLIFQPIKRAQIQICQSLTASTRGNGGFGHTGKL